MSFLTVIPQLLAAAAMDVEGIGSALGAANAAAAAPTTGILAAAEDEVSVAIAGLFSGYGQGFQSLSAQAEEFHQQFVQTLRAPQARMRAPRRPTPHRHKACPYKVWLIRPPRRC